ncbi:MAG: ABC transporter permease [Chloroflexota bacterium]|nr:ABC transporter permease [Chloroflexota bacterium]
MAVTAAPASVPGRRSAAAASARDARAGFLTGMRLGWAVESNWTDPLLFAIYSIAKPLAAALILVVMFAVISGGRRPEYLAFIVVGSALWNLVYGALSGFVQAMLEDRERYRMLKYVYVTPAPFMAVLIGRSAARVTASAVGTLITLAIGILFLGVRIDPLAVHWPLLVLSMTVGVIAIVSMGVALAGIVLQMRQESWSYPEAVAGSLYLLSGAVFPIDVLPAYLHPLALALPISWWLEATRRALVGHGAPGQLAVLGDAVVVVALLVSATVVTVASWIVFRAMEHRARDRGLIDQTSGS